MPTVPKLPADRFNDRWVLDPESGCHLWSGPLNHSGYGQFMLNGTMHTAHRAAWFLFVGELSSDIEVDHSYQRGCRYRHCVNWVEHLEPVTRSENQQRRRLRQTTCVHGHDRSESNVYVHPDGRWSCRLCRTTNQKRYALKKKSS